MSGDDDLKPLNMAEWKARLAGHPSGDPAVEPDDAELEQMIASATSGVHERRWHAAMPQRFIRADLDDFSEAPFYEEIRDWSFHADGRNLVLTGPTGVGKTRLAVAACRQAHYDGLEVRLFSIVRLLDLLRPGGPDGALADLSDIERLIIDDVGMEKPSEWTVERIGALFDARWSEERPTIITSNLDRDGLLSHLGEWAFSRLSGDGALRIRVVGPDRRQP